MSKRVLVTGKNSYIGDSFCNYATEYGYTVSVADTINDAYRDVDFSKYDAVVHVAAIVHQKENAYTREECFAVNTQLAFDVAQKAKNEGVKQFVFLSTMSVYGKVAGVITKDTDTTPANLYGESKLKAEQMIEKLADENFTVTILRPPIVYGNGCKGNYVQLSAFAKKFPVFPDFKSQRSMIYINNLSAFIKKAIDENLSGVFCPQDDEYVCPSDMVRIIAQCNNKKVRLTKVFNPMIKLCLKLNIGIFCKVFGDLVYDKSLCPDYEKTDFKTAVVESEK